MKKARQMPAPTKRQLPDRALAAVTGGNRTNTRSEPDDDEIVIGIITIDPHG